ncbi:SCAN domain-containing protein 3, partial [Lamellibrachia satsuma]
SFFQRKAKSAQNARIYSTGKTTQQSKAAVEASYVVSLHIAKAKKARTIGEDLIFPCIKDVVRLMIGTEAVTKLNAPFISDNTVQRRIVDMADDIKSQLVEQIKDSPIICLQLDESTDVSSCAQLIVYVRYIHNSEGIDWSKVKAVCTDGAPSMLGRNSGFQALVKEVSPDVIANHCMIHREALAAKTLPDPLNNVLKDVVKVVNYVKPSALDS